MFNASKMFFFAFLALAGGLFMPLRAISVVHAEDLPSFVLTLQDDIFSPVDLKVPAGMATQSAAFLEQTGAIDFLGENAWDTSAFLSEKSLLGRILHTLIGYCDQPSILQVIIYVCALGLIWAATKFAQSGSQIKAFVPPPKPISP